MGYKDSVAWEADYYSAYEAARLLGVSPARVRQMLRSGELDGERGPGVAEGVPGPWRVSAGALDAYRRDDHRPGSGAPDDAAETVAMPRESPVPDAATEDNARPPDEGAADTPSETSERLSEGVGALRAKAEEFLEELDRLEGRLEAAEMQEIALREAAREEKKRADALRDKLEAGETGERRGRWRGLFGR